MPDPPQSLTNIGHAFRKHPNVVIAKTKPGVSNEAFEKHVMAGEKQAVFPVVVFFRPGERYAIFR